MAAPLFISYSRHDKAQVYPLAEALEVAGIPVWIDREEIDPLDDFPARIREGLARCRALLAWYSPEYARSSYCQKELIAAWIGAQRLTHDVLSRILIVNPAHDVAHIALGDVGKQNYLAAPRDGVSQSACIESIRRKLDGLAGDFAAVRAQPTPEWHPHAQQGSARFVGRLRELWTAHSVLHPVGISEHEHAHVVAQLRGMGGIGKSLLAIEYAHRFAAAYPGGIHWLRAYGYDPNRPMEPEARERERRTQIENLALRHGISIRDQDVREIRRDLGRKLVAGGPYLWVVDDLPGELDQQQGFPDWCAPSANGCTLLTTRSGDYEGIGKTVAIDVLESQPALALLTQVRRPQGEREREDAKGLAADLGRHALALDVAGHFLLKTRDFAALRQEIRKGSETGSDPLGQLAEGLKGQLPGGHEKSIVATLLVSIRLLSEAGLNLLRLACELHGGTPISTRLAREALARALGLETQAAEDYLTEAVNQAETHSLVTISVGGAESMLSVHALVRYTMDRGDPAGSQGSALRRKLREGAISALVDLLQDVVDIRKHARLEMEIAHARELVMQAKTLDEAWLVDRLARFEGVRGNYRGALILGNKVLPILEQILGRDDPGTLLIRHNIAFWTGKRGEGGQALRLFQELLVDQERVLGKNHRNTLTTRNNIASWTGERGNASEALRLFGELLEDQKHVLRWDDHDILQTRHNIAFWTGETGNTKEALRLFRDLLPDQRRVLGRDHLGTLTTRSNIARLISQIEGSGKALRLSRNLLKDQRRVLGAEHPETLRTRNNIASWIGEGDADKALRLLCKLLADLQRVLGPDHPGTLTTRFNIAALTGRTGDVRKALRLLRELLPNQERMLGQEHPHTLRTRNYIAYLESQDTENPDPSDPEDKNS